MATDTLETTIMTRVTAKGLIAIAAAASIALFGAVSTAEAGKGKGSKGGGGFKISSHVNKGAKFNSGPKFNYSKKARSGFETVRYGEGKYKASKHGKNHYSNNKKWHGNYDHHYRYGKNYRRYNYAWAGLPLYTSYAGCGWIYRKAVSTGSDYWWDRYYQCTGSYY